MKIPILHKVSSAPDIVAYFKESNEHMQELVVYMKEFMQNCQNAGDFIKSIFTDPMGVLYKGLESLAQGFQSWGPDVMLISLMVLVIMYFLGFKSSKKWIGFILIMGLLLSTF